MNNFTYIAPTFYQFGRGAEAETGRLAAAEGMTNVLLVWGKGSVVRSGLLDRVKASLQAASIKWTDLSGISPNPTDDKVYEGIDLARSKGVDGLIAVGGGSAIDTAKAIAAGTVYDGDFWDFYAGKAVIDHALPVGVVLTIPAAGSEGSGNSVITRRDGLKKISLRTDRALRPRFACMNPELTFTLPPFQSACGICDMMIHILERYFTSTPEVEVTDCVAEGLLRAIITEAPKVMARPDDYDARANIMWSGTLAHNGVCGNGRTEDWSSHFMEHEISALHPEVAHGAGLAVIAPAYIEYVGSKQPGRVARLGRQVLGVTSPDDEQAVRETVSALRAFFKSLGLPLTLADLGVDTDEIPTLVSNLHAHKGATFGAYQPLTAADTEQIYRLAAKG